MQFKRPYFFAVAALPLLILLQNPKIHTPVHQVSQMLFKPALVVGSSLTSSVNGMRDYASHFWKAFQDQGRYQQQIQTLEAKLLEYKEMERENQRLHALFDFQRQQELKSVPAHIIGWDLSLLRKTILLDKGSRQLLKRDNTVVVPAGLVGRISDVTPEIARAILLIDPESRVSAVTSESRSHGVVSGDGSDKLRMKYINLDSGVAVGEEVITSGVGGLYPKGIAIGRIESMQSDPDGLHLSVRITPFVQFKKMEEVLCLDFSRRDF